MQSGGRPEDRREERHGLNLPIRVLGYDPDGTSWQELVETGDLSAGGAAFTVKRPVFRGQCLRLALPMPKSLRAFDHDEPAYRVYAIVRTATLQDAACRVGVMFFGKEPPRGYEDNPAARFVLPSDLEEERSGGPAPPPPPSEPEPAPDPYGRRAHERFDIFVEFSVELVDEWGVVLAEERTVADNISKGGARLMTATSFAKGEVIFLHEVGGPFETRAEIRDVHVGKDGIRRLHVRFLDGHSPDHLVRPR